MVGLSLTTIEDGYTVMPHSCPGCAGSGWGRRWEWDWIRKIEVRATCGFCNGTGIVLSYGEPRLSQLVNAGETQ